MAEEVSDIEVTKGDGKILFRLQSQDGTTVGDLIGMIGDGMLCKDGVLKANKAWILAPGSYIFTEKCSPNKTAFSVHIAVLGARMSSGARGNIFKKLQQHHAVYDATDSDDNSNGISVKYVDDDLIVDALFLEQSDAFNFQNDVSEWDMHKELVNLTGILIDPKTPVEITRPKCVARIMLQDYKPDSTESPCASLNDLSSYRLSIPPTEAVQPGTSLAMYQCIDKQPPGLLPYKSHLKDKSKFKTLQNNENNLLAVSWPFHQMMDGLNTDQGLPMVAISVRSRTGSASVDHDDRYPITLLLKFREETHAAMFQGNDNEGSKRIEGTNNWEVVVFVEDPKVFCACVAWKLGDTKRQWAAHQAFIDFL